MQGRSLVPLLKGKRAKWRTDFFGGHRFEHKSIGRIEALRGIAVEASHIAVRAMVRQRDQGKVRFIGISELSEADGTHEVLQRAIPTGAFDVVMLTLNFLLQTAAESVLPLCREHDVGAVVMMPLNQPSKESGLVSVPAALECIRRHVAAGNLSDEPPFTDADVLDFLQPYSVPAAGLCYVLSHEVSVCCVGMRSLERLAENLQVVDPPYLDPERMARLQELFGRIRSQRL